MLRLCKTVLCDDEGGIIHALFPKFRMRTVNLSREQRALR